MSDKYGDRNAFRQGKQSFSDKCSFKLSRALIVTKLSRLEFEQHRNFNLNQIEFEKAIKNRGTDYDAMLNNHRVHKNFERKVAQSFTALGVEVQLVNRLYIILR